MKVRLIVLIDFSDHSHKLMELAGYWSQMLHANLLLVHQVPGIVPAFTDSESRKHILEVELKNAESNLKKFSSKYLTGIENVDYRVTDRNLLLELPEITGTDRNDLILLGLKGTGILKKIFIGSTAAKIVDEVKATIVAIPKGVLNHIPSNLVVAVNESNPLNQAKLFELISIFKGNIKNLEIISVITSGDNMNDAKQYMSTFGDAFSNEVSVTYKVLKGEKIFDEIKNYVTQNHKTSYLVVQKGSRMLTDNLFRKFFINVLVHDGSMPLIVIP